MRVLVGCPVYERAWILPQWFDHVERSARTAGVDLEYAFAYTPSEDDTLELLYSWTHTTSVVTVMEGTHSKERNWGQKARIETMAALRNVLLEKVAELEPAYYLSLDSDLLVSPGVIGGLIADLKESEYDAVAPLAFLGPGQTITNGFTYDRHVRRRVKVLDALQPADVLCAAKMLPLHMVQNSQMRYGYHSSGEDIAFGDTARRLGYRLGLDTALKVKHIMEPDQLYKVDSRVGF